MSTHPIWMTALRKLADEHYDVAVLDLIQNDALIQAMERRAVLGLGVTSEPDLQALRSEAQALLPAGFALQSLYFQRFASMHARPIADLESACLSLSNCISALEGVAAQQMAQNVTLGTWAKIEQSIAERYAMLMRGAKTLEQHGLMSPHHEDRVASLTQRPMGPLAAFFDKAMTMMASQSTPERMRMAA